MTNRYGERGKSFGAGRTGIAPLLLVARRAKDEPTLELPRPALPLPLPRDPDYAIRPRETEREPTAPTRGVHVFDMV